MHLEFLICISDMVVCRPVITYADLNSSEFSFGVLSDKMFLSLL